MKFLRFGSVLKTLFLKKLFIIVLLAVCSTAAFAQQWSVRLGTGFCWTKLLPGAGSTPATSTLRYGFIYPALYLAPSLHFKASENMDADFCYQLSTLHLGIKHKTYNGGRESVYDIYSWHAFSIGVMPHGLFFNEKIHLGAFARMGLAYTERVGGGTAGNDGAGFAAYNTSSVFTPPGRWTPFNTLGVMLGPNAPNSIITDRLQFTISATICWKDIYDGYSTYNYALSSGWTNEKGEVKYRGAPLLLQVGADYRLFRFGKKQDYY